MSVSVYIGTPADCAKAMALRIERTVDHDYEGGLLEKKLELPRGPVWVMTAEDGSAPGLDGVASHRLPASCVHFQRFVNERFEMLDRRHETPPRVCPYAHVCVLDETSELLKDIRLRNLRLACVRPRTMRVHVHVAASELTRLPKWLQRDWDYNHMVDCTKGSVTSWLQ